MCTYLQLHQGMYYFRRGVPAEMQHLFAPSSRTLKPTTALFEIGHRKCIAAATAFGRGIPIIRRAAYHAYIVLAQH